MDEASAHQDGSEYVFRENLVLDIPGEGPVALSPDAIKKLSSREVQDMYQVIKQPFQRPVTARSACNVVRRKHHVLASVQKNNVLSEDNANLLAGVKKDLLALPCVNGRDLAPCG